MNKILTSDEILAAFNDSCEGPKYRDFGREGPFYHKQFDQEIDQIELGKLVGKQFKGGIIGYFEQNISTGKFVAIFVTNIVTATYSKPWRN